MALDVSTRSNYDAWHVEHTDLDATLDFDKKSLRGTVTYSLACAVDGCATVVLDTSYLKIESVQVDGSDIRWKQRARQEPLGSPLDITLGRNVDKGRSVKIVIAFATTDKCTALQWLDASPAIEKGGYDNKPYMFSQCQAIHARSMFPCFDTPAVKSPYSMAFRSPATVIASGLFRGAGDFEDGTMRYIFEQPIPIPSYLCAVASGDLTSARIGPRSLVYREPPFIYETQREMEPLIERFIQAAESFLPSYAWGEYSVIILPKSFPYGGMENPINTYATPTILAGDGSNLDVIAHELMHSWSGNGVTCASWSHFWLNEGWTVWGERKITAKLHGPAAEDFSALIGWRALEESVDNFGAEHEFTKLVQDLRGADPDDAFSSVPYEKGYNLLRELEGRVGTNKFFRFAYSWFDTFARRSVTTDEFRHHLATFFHADADATGALADVDWQTWLHAPGLPKKPEFDTSLAEPCYTLADRWLEARGPFSADDVAKFDAGQRTLFLETLTKRALDEASSTRPGNFDADAVAKLDGLYGFTESRNAEILHRTFLLALRLQAPSFFTRAAAFLQTVGRMKFVRPLFKALNAADSTLAHETFDKVKSGLHPICRSLVAKDLGLTASG